MPRAYRILSGAATLAMVAAGTALLAPAASAAPATLHVDAANGQDTGNCVTEPCKTIKYAIGQSGSGDTISVGPGTYHESLAVYHNLTITGAGSSGPDATVIEGDDNRYAAIEFGNVSPGRQPPVTGSVSHLRVTHTGVTKDDPGAAGISGHIVTLSVDDVVATGNSAGVMATNTALTITGSTLSGNLLPGAVLELAGNGPDPEAPTPRMSVIHSTVTGNGFFGVGALFWPDAPPGDGPGLIVRDSTVSGNKGPGVEIRDGSGLVTRSTVDANAGTGIAASGATLTVSNSTISNSTPLRGYPAQVESMFGGSGISAGGSSPSSIQVMRSTISGNTGQGIAVGTGGTATVANSTISGTRPSADGFTAVPAGGVVAFANAALSGDPASVTLTGSIVAAQAHGVPDCSGTITDGGYDLDDDASCTLHATGSISKGTAALAALADNGGPTPTQLPAKGSDAIDAIPAGAANCATSGTDQRGKPRLAGPKCDIGAVEHVQAALAIAPGTLPHATVGKAYHLALSATGGLGAPYAFSLAPGSALPADLTLSKGGLISGTPVAAGTFTFTVSVDDPVTRTYRLVVEPAAATSSSSPSASGSPAGSEPPLANTGTTAGTQLWWAAWLLGAGVIALAAGSLRRRATRRH